MSGLVILFLVVPFRIFPAARAHGRNGFVWTFVGMGIYLMAETLIIYGYALSYSLAALFFGWEDGFEDTALSFTSVLDLAAMGFGMACVEVLRYKLSNPSVPYFDSPPPPEQFQTP